MRWAIPGLSRPETHARSTVSWPRSIGAAAGVGIAFGVLTSIGQTLLPDDLRSLANASSPWSAAAFALAARFGGHDTRRSAILGGGALLAMLAGYSLATMLRGFPVGASMTLFWVAAALTAGPVIGLGAAWSRGTDRRKKAAGIAVLASILVGEALYGLTVIGTTTSPVYWTAQLIVGLGLVAIFGFQFKSLTAFALCAALTAAGAVAFYVLYSSVTRLG